MRAQCKDSPIVLITCPTALCVTGNNFSGGGPKKDCRCTYGVSEVLGPCVSYELGHGHSLDNGGMCIAPPPFCPNRGLSKHGDPVFPHFCAFFWNHRFCGSNPIATVVCSFVLQEV